MIRQPYHPNNLNAQPYPHWKVIALAWIGTALGIQFKIDGIPYGAPYHYRPDFVEREAERTGRAGSLVGKARTK